MAFFIKARILLHIARKNRSVAAGNLGQIFASLLGALLFGVGGIGAIMICISKGDLASMALPIFGAFFGLYALANTIFLIGQARKACRRLLAPMAQRDLFAKPYEQFEQELSKAVRQLVLF